MLPANFAHAQKLVLELVAQGCMLTAFCFSVMMMPIANMLGGADSKEASRRFRHWRNSMFDILQTAFGGDADGDGWDGDAVARLLKISGNGGDQPSFHSYLILQ